MSFPRLATSAVLFPTFTMNAAIFPGFTLEGGPKPNILTTSPTPKSFNHITTSPTTSVPTVVSTQNVTKKINSSDYDYEEPSDYEIFRNRLEELKVDWPLTNEDEDEIIADIKTDHPDKEDFDIYLIKHAYLRGDAVQKSLMLKTADKLHYTL